MLIH
jgi:hypothetical protein